MSLLAEEATAERFLASALGLNKPDSPFPWQLELLRHFRKGQVPVTLEIPTGLGKTAVMAIWLIARAFDANLPRRLVYVVDRRAVVDQATEVAMKLREFVDQTLELKERLCLNDRSLPVSTLRGQYVDNRDWLEDPATPVIIVGTVDMIGSRLLFQGYGLSRKMWPYNAGFLGVDAFFVLDEAHLVPPFERLIKTIANGSDVYGPRDFELRKIIPGFKTMSLSATGASRNERPFGLTEADFRHAVIRRRLDAKKRIIVRNIGENGKLSKQLAEEAWDLLRLWERDGETKGPLRCLVFCDKREDAIQTKKEIEGKAKQEKKEIETELFVGARRVLEREATATKLKKLGFIAGNSRGTVPAFLFATSAGEVGVDLDADCMVCDLVPWERMVQRLGRVNRRGDVPCGSKIIVLVQPLKPTKDVKAALEKSEKEKNDKDRDRIKKYEAASRRQSALLKLFQHLSGQDSTANASPCSLHTLREKARQDGELQQLLEQATTPEPLSPGLTRALIDAWSMTSLEEHPGRPEVDPWLRGWDEDKSPETTVVWRRYLPIQKHGNKSVVLKKEVDAFFEAAPVHVSEWLTTETFRVEKCLKKRAQLLLKRVDASDVPSEPTLSKDDVLALVLTRAGDLRQWLCLKDLAEVPDEERNREPEENQDGNLMTNAGKKKLELAGAMLIVDSRLAGLKDGLLDEEENTIPWTADSEELWVGNPAEGGLPVIRFRVRSLEEGQVTVENQDWAEVRRLAREVSEEGETISWLIVEKLKTDNATEEDRSVGRRPQLLNEHSDRAKSRACELADQLSLPKSYKEMLALAAELHDRGKSSSKWQKAFHAPDELIYAKTKGPISYALLDGYRHEFGSSYHAKKDHALSSLPGNLRELALHLIAAHHGFSRPVIETRGFDKAPPSALSGMAQEIALSFACLQLRWGPWGLAWWEALLRAIDQQASRDEGSFEKTTAMSEEGG